MTLSLAPFIGKRASDSAKHVIGDDKLKIIAAERITQVWQSVKTVLIQAELPGAEWV